MNEREQTKNLTSSAVRRYLLEKLTNELYGNCCDSLEEELADMSRLLNCANSLIVNLLELNNLIVDENVALQVELDSLKRDRTAAGGFEDE